MRKVTFLFVLFLASMLIIGGCFGNKSTSSNNDNDGTIVVDSNPQGATIFLDGEAPRLVTPATISNVDPGQHEILLQLDGYMDWNEVFNLEAGETYNIDAQLVEEGNYNNSIEVYSTPSGASVYLNGTNLNVVTPLVVYNVPPGFQHIRVYLDGYNEYNEYFDLAVGEDYVINADLTVPQPPLPVFVFYQPADQQTFDDNVINVEGFIELDNGSPFTGDHAILTLNGFDQEIQVINGDFSETISITAGANEIWMRANSANGDTGVSAVLTVYGNFVAPDIEVVLTWNTPTSDMDLHIWNPLGEWCYWWNQVISDGSLDVDDTEGYGPETFTAPTATVGNYVVRVNSFSLDEDPYTDCTVQIFFGGALAGTYGPYRFLEADGMENVEEEEHPAWWNVVVIEVQDGRGIRLIPVDEADLSNILELDYSDIPGSK